MPVNRNFLAARAAERRNRDLAHIRALTWLTLRSHGRELGRTPLNAFTLRHRIELRRAGNAFIVGRPALLDDVFLFLWRLHPLYRAPILGREKSVAHLAGSRLRLFRLWFAFGSFKSARAHRKLTKWVRCCELSSTVIGIREFLELAMQDAPASDGNPSSLVTPPIHDADSLVAWLMTTCSMTHDAALDMPIAVANQLHRTRLLSYPDGELDVFDPSDALL